MGRFPVTYVLLVPRHAQARACLSTGARVTVVLMTFRVLAQGGEGVSYALILTGFADGQGFPARLVFFVVGVGGRGLNRGHASPPLRSHQLGVGCHPMCPSRLGTGDAEQQRSQSSANSAQAHSVRYMPPLIPLSSPHYCRGCEYGQIAFCTL